jgi:Spy/CpxP family protein refolding chaperone
MKKWMTMVTVIALAAIVTSPVMAFRGMGGGYGWGAGYVADVASVRGIDLTAEQTEKINALREAHLKDIKTIQDKLYAKSGDLRVLWLAETPDERKILSLQKEVRSLRDQLADKSTTYRLEARKILTDEQLAKVQAYGQGRGVARMGGRPGMVGARAYGWSLR